MRRVFAAVSILALAASLGCFGASTVRRAGPADADARDEYVKTHPDDPYTAFVGRGEIVRGMPTAVVIASWGMPNVYALSRIGPLERWIYYVRDEGSASLFIYDLTFRADTLSAWDITRRRSTGQSVASSVKPPPETPPAPARGLKKH